MTDPVEGPTEELTTGVGGSPTARVADSYGPNPHEHKPSQDPFLPDVDAEVAEAKQAATGGADVDDETAELAAQPYPEEEPSAGTSSSTSPTSEPSSDEKKTSAGDSPAPTTASRTEKDPTDSSSARSTATGRASSSGSASK